MIDELPPDSSVRWRKRKRSWSRSRSRSSSPSPSVSLPSELTSASHVEGGVKDVCVCVRLAFEPDEETIEVKWLRLKIPGNLLEKLGGGSPSSIPSSSSASSPSLPPQSPKEKEDGTPKDEDGTPKDEDGTSKDEDGTSKDDSPMKADTLTLKDQFLPGTSHEHSSLLSGVTFEPFYLSTGTAHEPTGTIQEEPWPLMEASDSEDELYPNKVTTISGVNFVCKIDSISGPFDFPPLVPSKFPYTYNVRCAPIGSIMYALGGDNTHIDHAKEINLQAFGVRRPPNPLVNTFAITGGRGTVKPPPLNTSSTSSDDPSHRLHFCDFSKQDPKWEISPTPLMSPRLWPKLVSMEGKIYAFGGNLLTDDEAPFAEVYDPEVGYWEPLPNPPFGKLADHELFVFPIPKSFNILVVGFLSSVVYTFNIFSWYWCPFPARSHLCEHLYLLREPECFHPVCFDDTLHWLDSAGRLCVYKLQGDGHFYRGDITGLKDLENTGLERIITTSYPYPLALLPLSKDLLGILWCINNPIAIGFCCSSTLHITIVRISLHKQFEVGDDSDSDTDTNSEPQPSLTASAVSCLCFPFLKDIVHIIDAYLIDDNKESWQLMSSCSPYRRINPELHV